ncbi:hypothetical protein WJX74_002306 [Apatococcus lobatus]|uniref:Nucleotide-diphospho-sugar transferase domain-containing protein n=1 Tax=Apatococcus lobatus TaxID=904363 RepID=A0AAW1QUF1_9CHLO
MRLLKLPWSSGILLAAVSLIRLAVPAACFWRYQDAAWQSHFVPIASHQLQSPRPETQTLVDPDSSLLSVLLAFRPSPLETGNALNQLRLFSRFFQMQTLKEWIVVTPAIHLKETSSFFKEAIPAELPQLSGDMFRILWDGECVPEFDPDSPLYRDPSLEGYGYDKWVRQQVVKLACARHVTTPFFIVVDADMFAVHHFKASDVFHHLPCNDEVVVCDSSRQVGYRSKNDVELTGYDLANNSRAWHQEWWAASADLLELNIDMDWPVVPGVTPQTLSTHVAVQLGKYLEARFGVASWTGFLLDRAVDKGERNAAEGRSTTDPPAWTEYTLYFLFARHAQLYDQYHQEGTILQWRSVWDLEAFERWEPCKDTFEWDLGYMSLVQSRMKLDPEVIWQKILPCLHQLSSDQAMPSQADLQILPPLLQQQPILEQQAWEEASGIAGLPANHEAGYSQQHVLLQAESKETEKEHQQQAEPADTWYLPHAGQAAAHGDQPQHAMEVAVLSEKQEQQLQEMAEPAVVLEPPPAAAHPENDAYEHPHVRDLEMEASAMFQQQLEHLAEPIVESDVPHRPQSSLLGQQHHPDDVHMPPEAASRHVGSEAGQLQGLEEARAAHLSPGRAASRNRLRSSLEALVAAAADEIHSAHDGNAQHQDSSMHASAGAVAPPGVLGEPKTPAGAGEAEPASSTDLPAIDPSGHHRSDAQEAQDRSRHSRQYPLLDLDEAALSSSGKVEAGKEADAHIVHGRQYPAVDIVKGAAEATGEAAAESEAHHQHRHHASLDPGRHLSHATDAHSAQAVANSEGVDMFTRGKKHGRKLS